MNENIEERLQSLGELSLIIEQYIITSEYESDNNFDGYNIAGFEADKIASDFGWYFKNLPKPTLEQLEEIKANME